MDGATRITPAWAGKSSASCRVGCVDEDHPRMGGEKTSSNFGLCSIMGSPPHGRGKVAHKGKDQLQAGITPAWAGKRVSARLTRPIPRDHPRMGGEKFALPQRFAGVVGSPPHGRGKAEPVLRVLDGHRITPAWAGKRYSCTHNIGKVEDHPRMGGEKSGKCAGGHGRVGSPPHGRGKVEEPVMIDMSMGITPAWAGKSGGDY